MWNFRCGPFFFLSWILHTVFRFFEGYRTVDELPVSCRTATAYGSFCLFFYHTNVLYVHCGNCGKREFFKILHFYSFLLFMMNNFLDSWSYCTVPIFQIKKSLGDIRFKFIINCKLFLMLCCKYVRAIVWCMS